ncbi:MAG: DHA2 family efflux MFS transporter permease subunit [Chloroflexi bacterium]|nr:DHA2 family efflux MFS transporter permease subunit [Chloroflexota bacterium]
MNLPAQPVDYSRKWFVMTAVAMSTFLATIDGSIINVAMPTLVTELDTVFALAQWVILAYLLAQTTLMPSIGRLGDMIGKKRLYTAGIAIFTLGSVLCGLAPTIYWLIGARVVQAVGSAMALGLGMAIVTEAFPPQERGKALGLNGAFVSIGVVIGPTLGGLMLNSLSWHWIFFVNLPVGLLGLVLAWRYVPDLRPSGRAQFDFAGAVTLFISLLSVLLALTMGQQVGFSDGRILALLAAGGLFLALFVWLEMRHPQPMINLRLFRQGMFSLSLLTGTMVFLTIAGTTLLLPFYLQNMRGFDTRQVGLMMAFIPVFLGVAAPLSGAASDRYGTRIIASAGLLILAAGLWVMRGFDAQTAVIGFALGVMPIGLGIGVFQSPNNSAVMGSVPPEHLGVASGLLGLSRTLGQTTGIALFGAFWAARTAAYAGGPLPGGATIAPIPAQIAGLSDTFMAMLLLVLVALSLSLWAISQTRRTHKKAAA